MIMNIRNIAAALLLLSSPALAQPAPSIPDEAIQQLADQLHKLDDAAQAARKEAQRHLPPRKMIEWLSDKEHERDDDSRGKMIEKAGCDVVDDALRLDAADWMNVSGRYLVHLNSNWWPVQSHAIFEHTTNPMDATYIWYGVDSNGWLHICGFAPGPQA